MKTFQLSILFCFINIVSLKSQEIGYINDSDGYTNLRLEPSVKSEIVTTIKKGHEFFYEPNNSSNWWQVEYNNVTGYLHNSRIKNLNKIKTEISLFFQEFYKIDKNNVEFGQLYNEKLFLFTQDYPLASMNAFCEQKKEIQAFLITQFESPIHDLIDLDLIYSRLLNLTPTCSEISKVLNTLNVDSDINGLELNNVGIDYKKKLDIVANLYLITKEIPELLLLKLVPRNHIEFGLYYGTTGPDHKLSGTGFFYNTTHLIFEKVTSDNNDDFYLPCLKLLSFADGEFAESFIYYLEVIIEMDKTKFCNSIANKEYVKHNPIKYYSELNKCK